MFHEDQPERIPGPELADFLGLPINDAARQWALAWDPSRLTAPEHQCQVHTVAYMYRGPLLLRIWEERDPQTQDLIALRQYISNYEQNRTIYMDGRPHPPDYAPHTWMGFSTGKWEGNILTVTTTHIKQGWHRRNGLPSSDRITLVEHFIRHDDHLTHVTVVTDPDYLTEPLIKSQDFTLNEKRGGNRHRRNHDRVAVSLRVRRRDPGTLSGGRTQLHAGRESICLGIRRSSQSAGGRGHGRRGDHVSGVSKEAAISESQIITSDTITQIITTSPVLARNATSFEMLEPMNSKRSSRQNARPPYRIAGFTWRSAALVNTTAMK